MVINAAGARTTSPGRGLELPSSVRHEYLAVNAPGLDPTLPVIRIPDSTLYLRAEINSLLCGGWEPEALSTDPRQFADGVEPPPIDPDWNVLTWFAEKLAPEIPQVEELGVRSVFKGWPTFTPDGRFIVSELAREGVRHSRRLCPRRLRLGRHRRHVIESILDPNPSAYVELSPDRFDREPWDWADARRRAQHIYGRTTSAIERRNHFNQAGSVRWLTHPDCLCRTMNLTLPSGMRSSLSSTCSAS
jgi:hypothetical protein